MSKAGQHIDQLFKDKLKKGKISTPGGAEWKSIRGKIGMKNFFGFNPFQFNIFYLTAGIVGAGALGYFMYESGHFKKEEPVKEYCIEKDTVKNKQENNHHIFHEEIKRIENNHHENGEHDAPSLKKSDRNRWPEDHKNKNIHPITTKSKKDKKNITTSDSLNEKSYFCNQNADSIHRIKQRGPDTLNKINTKELNLVEKPGETVLKFRQDTILQRDTTIIKRDKLRFKWKKQ